MRFLHIVDRDFSSTNVNNGKAIVSVIGGRGEGTEEIALTWSQEGFFHERSRRNQTDNFTVEHGTLALLPTFLCFRRGLAITHLYIAYFHLIANSHF